MSLTFVEVTMPAADFHGKSILPALADMGNIQNMTESNLDEDDELFIGFGFLRSIFPYQMQNLYDRTLTERSFHAAILENDYLKAIFLPELGGRLWSLFDKKQGKELLFKNPVIRPCNLAVRNAWLSGGIEYNCGMVGHGPFTCDKLFTAQTRLHDGTPVLRMYEFERIRRCVYQMDFFLPENSPLLYGRMRIVNPNRETVPMYWWTNIAVPTGEEYRNVVDADTAYVNTNYVVGKVTVPEHDGRDVTYPTNNPIAVDHFWKIGREKRKFMAYLDQNGYGFVQTSTARLKGRKLFVWGQGKGGARWQEFLTGNGSEGKYAEIQAGIASTQYECLPMPPKTAWEWVECYGALQAEPTAVHGDWRGAIDEVSQKLSAMISQNDLETLLQKTHAMAVSPAEKTVLSGSGWGKLEALRREKQKEAPLCRHLDFGALQPEQKMWQVLLDSGMMPDQEENGFPLSWMLQSEWTKMLEKAPDGYSKFLHLAAVFVAEGNPKKAEDYIQKALSLRRTPAALFIFAQGCRLLGRRAEWAASLQEACEMLPADISLAREALAAALAVEHYDELIRLYENCENGVHQDGRSTMFYAFAFLRRGEIDRAETLLHREGGLVVADIREGETSITDLYLELEKAKANREGRPFDPDSIQIPKRFDFRMFV